MAEERIKGQEVELMLVEGNVPLTTIQDVRNFEMTAQLEILKEGYLGETTDRRDSVYRGYHGKMEVHFENGDIIDFMRRLIDKARRRVPGSRVNCKVTLVFPGGDRTRLVLKNLAFGDIPMNFAGRTDYGAITLDFEGEDFNKI